MKEKSVLMPIAPLPIAFIVGVLINFPINRFWNTFPVFLTLLLMFFLGVIPTTILNFMRKDPLMISLPASALLWLGVMSPAILFPQMITLTIGGCWATGCEICPPGGCLPDVIPTPRFYIVLIIFVGLILVSLGSLCASLIKLFIAEIQ